MKPGSFLAALLLGAIAIGHLIRLAFRVPVTVGELAIPLWPSVLAVVVPAVIVVLLWRDARPKP